MFDPAFSKERIADLNAQFTLAALSPSLAAGKRIAEAEGSKLALEAIARFSGVPIPTKVATQADYDRLDELVSDAKQTIN